MYINKEIYMYLYIFIHLIHLTYNMQSPGIHVSGISGGKEK